MTLDSGEALRLLFARNRNWSELATFGVFIGLVGDILVIFLFSKDKPKSETWLAFACTLLIAGGVYGEFRFGGEASLAADQLQQISDEKIAALNKEAGDARQKAGEAENSAGKANERASKNENEAAQLRKEAEAEHLARVNLEQQGAIRDLALKERGLISSQLSVFAGQNAEIVVFPVNFETVWAASELDGILRDARWKLPPVPPVQLASAPNGLMFMGLGIRSTNDRPSSTARSALFEVLKETPLRG